MVITSDKTAIAAIRAAVIAAQQSDGGIYDGSNAVGSHVCGFNVSKNGHEYQVDVYGNLPGSYCSATSQASFLSSAP